MNSSQDHVSHDRFGDRDAGGLWRRHLLDALDDLRGGTMVVHDVFGTTLLGHADGEDPLRITLHVHDAAFYRRVVLGGSVGAGEAYCDGLWDCEHLVSLIRLLVRNRDRLDTMQTGTARLAAWLLRGWEALRPNTRGGSRRNISAHYDLGNPLFGLFLSDDLMYSSALYADPGETLEQASSRKLETICDKLELGPDDHVLEIGTGWGGFAIHAAARRGCRITTTTLSREQAALARQRIGNPPIFSSGQKWS